MLVSQKQKALCAVGGREILGGSEGIKGKVMEETVFYRKETHMNEGPGSIMPCKYNAMSISE